MRFIHLFSLVLTAGALGFLGGCDDSTGFEINPLLVTDTLEVFAPLESNADRPSALDITSCNSVIRGARFPERAADATEFDFAIRQRGGQLVFVPSTVIGLPSRSAITRSLAGRTFESLIEAPAASEFVADSVVAIQAGGIYAARSRDITCGFGGGQQYAKLQVLSVDPATGSVRVRLVTNERFSDLRLVEEG